MKLEGLEKAWLSAILIGALAGLLASCTESETVHFNTPKNISEVSETDILTRHRRYVQKRNKDRAILATDKPPPTNWDDLSIRFEGVPDGMYIYVIKDHKTGREAVVLRYGSRVETLKEFK